MLDASAVPDLEITVLSALEELDEVLRDRGVVLWVSALNERPLEMFGRGELAERFAGRLFPTTDAAVEQFERHRIGSWWRSPGAGDGYGPTGALSCSAMMLALAREWPA